MSRNDIITECYNIYNKHNREVLDCLIDARIKIEELEYQLKQKFEDMPMTDFIMIAKKNGYEVQLNEDVDRIVEIGRLKTKVELLEKENKSLNLENQKLFEDLYCEPNNKKLAIEELEFIYIHLNNRTSLAKYVKNRLNALRGEK